MKNIIPIFLSIFIIMLCLSCSKHERHSVSFYKRMGAENADKEGFHANEAQRILDFKEQNKEAHENETNEFKEELNDNLNNLNKPNRYNSKPKKAKRKRFSFYF